MDELAARAVAAYALFTKLFALPGLVGGRKVGSSAQFSLSMGETAAIAEFAVSILLEVLAELPG